MVKFYNSIANSKLNANALTEKALANINPKKSHTFRKGESGQWRKIFNEEHTEVFKKVAGDLLIRLGYERNLDW